MTRVLVQFGCSIALIAAAMSAAQADTVLAEPILATKPTFGDGWNTAQERLLGRCLEPKLEQGAVVWVGNTSGTIEFSQSLDQRAVSSDLGFAASARARYGVVTGSAEAKFARSTEQSSTSLVTTYRANYSFKSQRALAWKLSNVGAAANEDDQQVSGKWAARCGHEAVHQIDYGAKLYFSIRLDFSTGVARESFAAKFKISGPSAEASAELAKASQQFSKDVRVTISVLQLGGNTARVAEIFGTGGADSERLAFVECTLGTFEKCSTVLGNALKYAAGSDEASFTGQLVKAVSIAKPDEMPIGLGAVRYITKPVDELIVRPKLPVGVGPAVRNSREKLAAEFERQLAIQLTADRILGNGRGVLSERQFAILQQLSRATGDNIDDLLPVSEICYDGAEQDCITSVNAVLNALIDVDENATRIQPETFAQSCYLSSDGATGSAAVKAAADAVIRVAKRQGLSVDEAKEDRSAVCERVGAYVDGLTRLTVADAGLVNVVPFSFMSRLQFLDLSGNNIVDPTPLNSLKGLTILDLSRNDIPDAASLSSMTGLRRLILVNNRPNTPCPFSDSKKCSIGYFNHSNLFVAKDDAQALGISCSTRGADNRAFVGSIVQKRNSSVLLVLSEVTANGNTKRVSFVERTEQQQLHKPRGVWEAYRCSVAVLPNGDVAMLMAYPTNWNRKAFLYLSKGGVSKLQPISLKRAATTLTQGLDADTMVVLQGGDVLLFGQEPARVDPLTGAVRLLGPDLGSAPLVPRRLANLTRLQTGSILISGGIAANTPTAGVESFDESTNTFTLVGMMKYPRYLHAATALMDGRVLFTGGLDSLSSSDPIRQAETISPLTGVSERTRWFMTVRRAAHSATVLPNGLVLLTGGYETKHTDNNSFPGRTMLSTAKAEVFNPRTEEFFELSDRTNGGARAHHVVIPLSNGVFALIGGASQSSNESTMWGSREIDLFIAPPGSSFVAPIDP